LFLENAMDGMVIIGAGECGTRAAFALRENGYAGRITLIGAEPHLPYERPPLSKPNASTVEIKWICTSDALCEADIDYIKGVSVSAIDAVGRHVSLADGRTLPFARLLLATGARPRQLSCPGAEHALEFRTRADAETVFSRAATGRHVAIVGGGLIGMELAAVLRQLGIGVSVIEAAPRTLGRAVPARLAEMLHARHVAAGVQFHLGLGVSSIAPGGIALSDGQFLPSDLIVSATGVQAEAGLAEAAGLATGNGILTDACLRTSAVGIFAAGDCAAVAQPGGKHFRFESWRNARAQAETAARNMMGGAEAFVAVPSCWSDQYDLGLQVAGLPDGQDERVSRSLTNGQLEFYLRDGRLVAAAGLGLGTSIARDIKLAELLIAARAHPEPSALADVDVNLKTLLKSAREVGMES
jgi:3-phenylpropionate/trans-cinnamate dioxygenase ferredoxin reductase component